MSSQPCGKPHRSAPGTRGAVVSATPRAEPCDDRASPVLIRASRKTQANPEQKPTAEKQRAGQAPEYQSAREQSVSKPRRPALADDEVFTVVQAASYLGVRPWTLRHWVSQRKIDVVKYGNGLVRVRRSVLDRYMATCTIKARSAHGQRSKEEPQLLERAGVGPEQGSLAH